MTYSFHPEARTELRETTLYYSGKSPSLALAFYAEVEYAIEGIIENPQQILIASKKLEQAAILPRLID